MTYSRSGVFIYESILMSDGSLEPDRRRGEQILFKNF